MRTSTKAIKVIALTICVGAMAIPVLGASGNGVDSILFTKVNVFDGVKAERIDNASVLVEGNLIRQVSTDVIKADGATVIDGGGRTLMPGLSDAHWHCLMASVTPEEIEEEQVDYLYAAMTAEAEKTLLRGFTTVRDVGGVSFGLKKAIDQGVVPGPRILPSGAMISQTSGHFDMTKVYEQPRRFGGRSSRREQLGVDRVADGVDEMLSAVRMNLKGGASQIKLATGGGVGSAYDPLESNQFTLEELKTAVAAAGDWGTYVTVHAYSAEGIKRAIEAGVKCIEHGHLMDEECARLMKEKGIWLCIQPFAVDDPGMEFLSPEGQKKNKLVCDGFEQAMNYANKYQLKLGFGTDLIFSPQTNGGQGDEFAKFSKYLSNLKILRMATSANAELFSMSGDRHPYRDGDLGVIRAGAYADILLVDGNPLEDLSLLGSNGKHLSLIMKDGNIFKNTIE